MKKKNKKNKQQHRVSLPKETLQIQKEELQGKSESSENTKSTILPQENTDAPLSSFENTTDISKASYTEQNQEIQENTKSFRRNTTHRSWHLTINNPKDAGFDHEKIRTLLAETKNLRYYCMSDELGDCYHTHLYLYFQNSVRFSAIKKIFPTAHIEEAKKGAADNIAYIQKSGKWENSDKHSTFIPGTFEEWGEAPQGSSKEENASMKRLYKLIEEGKSNAEIYAEEPKFIQQVNKIGKVRNDIRHDKTKGTFRCVEVNYLYGETGIGKTRYVMEKFKANDIFRVTNYKNPFDRYEGQDIMVFDEFRGQIPISDMLNYLDGYYCALPCRYEDQTATYTKVYLISNEPFETLYQREQKHHPDTYKAFCRRITNIGHLKDYLEQDIENPFPQDATEHPSDCSLAL